MKNLELTQMENLRGGSTGGCLAAVGGALLFVGWMLSVPLTGGISLGLALTGAGTAVATSGAIVDCMEN